MPATDTSLSRVWVTGMGVFSPLGGDLTSSFDSAVAGRSAIRPAPSDVCEWMPQSLAAMAPDPAPLLDRQAQALDRATQLAMVASQQALDQSGLLAGTEPADRDRIGVYGGIGFGGAHTIDALYRRFQQALASHAQTGRNPTVMHPLSVPRMMPNAPVAAISMKHGLRGSTYTFSVACASSAVALGEAMRAIRHGWLDAAVVFGTEAMITQGAFMAWNALRVLAQPDAGNLERSCRPFDRRRSGFVLGEGAACLVLERADLARRRQAAPLAELCGYGTSSDAAHLTAPSQDGQERAIRAALHDAGMTPGDIGYVNAHGTATDAGDPIEAQSIRSVFGDHAAQLPVSSTKAVHGHLIGAAGALEMALSIQAMNTGWLPPTAGLEDPDPACPVKHVAGEAIEAPGVGAVLSNSFAFGGSNACLIARRPA
ncbi:MAG: beta-ketoacyl-[acyl-carrier-protein] synthase family protein [Burkholderiaceae bacterium]